MDGTKEQPEKSTWSLGLSDEEDDDINVEKIIGSNNSQSEEFKDIDDPDIVSILQDIEKEVQYGPDLLPKVAESFQKTVTRPLTKENKETLKEKIKIPGNCKLFTTPKVNQEIWRLLPQQAKINDLKSQQMQQLLGSQLCILSSIADIAAKNKDSMKKEVTSSLIQLAIDGSNMIGDQFQALSNTRRYDMKRFLNPEYAGICNNKPVSDEWLFGSDLSESLKSSKATTALMKNTVNRNYRFEPYRKPSTATGASVNLNYNRPFSGNRKNGQHHFRPNYQSQRPRHQFQSQNSNHPFQFHGPSQQSQSRFTRNQ